MNLSEKALQVITLSAFEKGNELQLSMADLAVAIAIVLEEAAKVCEAQHGFNEYHHQCAAAIRALIPSEER